MLQLTMQCGRPGFNPWVAKIPRRMERLPTPAFWPSEFHGLYSPWGRRVGNSILSGFHIVIKTVWSWGKVRQIDHWNRVRHDL